MQSFSHYTKIKNNYCLAYYGNEPGIIDRLFTLKDLIKEQLPEIQLTLVLTDKEEDIVNLFAYYQQINNEKDLLGLFKEFTEGGDI